MGRAIGGSIGPFNDGQSIFDFLDDKVLNQLAKAVAGYKGLSVAAPLSIHRGPMADTIGLQKRIDNFIFCELLEDLVEDTSAAAKVVRRDQTDDFVADSALQFKVRDSDIAVGGLSIKRYAGQRGIAFQNPFSKHGNWEFLSLEIQQGGTISNFNVSEVDELVLPGPISCESAWHTVPLDKIEASTPGSSFNLSNFQTTVDHFGPLKICYKVFGQREGLDGVSSDDSFECRVSYKRGVAAFTHIPYSWTIGLIDDVDVVCGVIGPPFIEKALFEGVASCPTFYFNAEADDIFILEVRRKAGNEAITINELSSFMTFEYNR